MEGWNIGMFFFITGFVSLFMLSPYLSHQEMFIKCMQLLYLLYLEKNIFFFTTSAQNMFSDNFTEPEWEFPDVN